MKQHRTAPDPTLRTSSFGIRARRRALLLAPVTVAVCALLAACTASTSLSGESASPAPSARQILRVGLSNEPPPVVVGADIGGAGYSLDALIARGLMLWDSNGKVVPALAKTAKTIDTKTYQFTLRSGLKFNDGSPLTADNVKDTLLYLRQSKNAARTLKGMSNIETIDARGDQVTVHLKTGDPDFLQYLADPTAFIAPKSSLVGNVIAYVGDGPFMVKDMQKGVKMTLVKNPHFYDASSVKLKEIELVYYPDDQARTNAITSGEVNLIDYVPWSSFAAIQSTSNLTLDAVFGPMMDIEFNVTKGPFANPLVRQAVAYAANRENVIKAAFFGNAKPNYGIPLGSTSPYYTKANQNLWSYDPGKAKKLLAQAGYPNGFSATLLTTSQYLFHQDTALSIQADLKKIGIDVTLKNPDWATRQQASTSGAYDVKINGWSGIVTSPAYIEAQLGGPNVAKSYDYNNPDLAAALARGRTGTTDAERKAGYAKAFALMQSDVPFVPLAQREQGFAFDSKVKGFKNIPGFASFYSFYTVASTYIAG
ncbi:ABC transporter substrate-binding protein [Streptomyces chartreusis]|uniref:ABC transporter substrate-binding protein n=1 Tax=Streptomyces chartreusis TaxID=1969 RepID=UPI0033E46BE0